MAVTPTSSRPLRVGVDGRVVPGKYGGVEQVILGLAHGLSSLTDGDEEYVFFVLPGHAEWLQPYVSGPVGIAEWRPPSGPRRELERIRAGIKRRIAPGYLGIRTPHSNGAIEAAGVDVMHFTKQDGFRTAAPTLYHPHDLQHVHFPEFFAPREVRRRERQYADLCNQARFVCVTSQWGRSDLISHYDLEPSKVRIVHLAPALDVYDEPEAADAALLRGKLGIPADFAFYPAQTWPHKNHIRLLEALALLRDRRGIEIPLVCSGHRNDHYAVIEQRVRDLSLGGQVHFVGFVDTHELRQLYHDARMLVFPTLFEAAGGFGPIAEAFLAGTAVACASVTSLPEETDGAAELFDPLSVDDIARALLRVWSDSELRAQLARLGHERVGRFTWERSARTFRAYYRLAAGRPLTDEDQMLVDASPEF